VLRSPEQADDGDDDDNDDEYGILCTSEQAMGRWVMGQWVKWVTFWMGHVGHGSMHVDP